MNNQTFREQYGQWALVTGASAGIGAEFARQLALRGLNLILVARREARLKALAHELNSQHGVKVRVAAADLTQPDFMSAIRQVAEGLDVGLLVNNAGGGLMGALLDNEIGKELGILDLNTRAPLILTHEFGRQMRQRGRGGIIFLSSLVGYQGTPYVANYAGTKAYNLIMAEALWYELKGHGIDVLALSPGGVRTEGMDSLARQLGGEDKLPPLPLSPVQPVVTAALDALGKASSLIPGRQNSLMTFFTSKLLSRKQRTTMMGSMMKKSVQPLAGTADARAA